MMQHAEKALFSMLEMLVYLKCSLRLFFKKLLFWKYLKMDYIFVEISLSRSWFRNLGLEIFRFRSWSRINYRVAVSVSVSTFVVSATSLIRIYTMSVVCVIHTN